MTTSLLLLTLLLSGMRMIPPPSLPHLRALQLRNVPLVLPPHTQSPTPPPTAPKCIRRGCRATTRHEHCCHLTRPLHAYTIVSNTTRHAHWYAHWYHLTRPATLVHQPLFQTQLDRSVSTVCSTMSNNGRLPDWLPSTCTTSAATARTTSAFSPPFSLGPVITTTAQKSSLNSSCQWICFPNALVASYHGPGNVDCERNDTAYSPWSRSPTTNQMQKRSQLSERNDTAYSPWADHRRRTRRRRGANTNGY